MKPRLSQLLCPIGIAVALVGLPSPAVAAHESSTLDWGDAGIGAAAAFGVMLLAGGVVLTSRHHFPARRTAEPGT